MNFLWVLIVFRVHSIYPLQLKAERSYKQNEITSPVCYEQDFWASEKNLVDNTKKDTLEYRNKKSGWFSAMVSFRDCSTSFRCHESISDPVVTVSLNNRNKKSEYNYRLVISAYNLTHPNRKILCSSNKKVKIEENKVAEQSALFKLDHKRCSATVNKIEVLAKQNANSLMYNK